MPDHAKLPIVYVRGFAGDTSGINRVVQDPFYGFNEGSTHVRVGPDNEPSFHQFESPLLRLHLDEGYHILVQGGQEAYLDTHERIPPDSMWIHRFYDASASTWATKPREFRMEDAAADLLRLIRKLKEKSGAPRVHLVAHSMGGLVCRCLIQKILPDLGENPADHVDKLFTYGTPHGGIAFDLGFGLMERLRDAIGVNGADIFGPQRMYEYLTPVAEQDEDGPTSSWSPREMPVGQGALPLHRVFCLVGTNPSDYDVAHGLSSAAVGVRSDGLVQIDNARVPGAHQAFVHRSHSGRYGLVNSEEGYQNLRRFLFGDLKVRAELVGHRLPVRDGDTTWQAEVKLSVRGLPVVLHERLAKHWCPIQLPKPDGGGAAPVLLATAFLRGGAPRPEDSGATVRYVLHVRLLSLREKEGILRFDDHLEQTADFSDVLVVDVGTGRTGSAGVWATWNSEIPGTIREHRPGGEPIGDEDQSGGVWVAHLAFPDSARPILGDRARIRLTVTPWN
jgi:pimeloyl-ACP methyl ester carboxylesterase